MGHYALLKRLKKHLFFNLSFTIKTASLKEFNKNLITYMPTEKEKKESA